MQSVEYTVHYVQDSIGVSENTFSAVISSVPQFEGDQHLFSLTSLFLRTPLITAENVLSKPSEKIRGRNIQHTAKQKLIFFNFAIFTYALNYGREFAF